MRYEEIYIARYNNGERNFKREITIFDQFYNEQLFGEQGVKQLIEIYAQKLKETNPIAHSYFEDYTDLTVISIDIDNLDEEMRELKDEIYEHSKTVGGDGDSFDYFPDLIFAFQQICEQLDRKEDYNEIVRYLNENDIIADDTYEEI